MKFIIIMLLAMIVGGVIGKYVDDQILYPTLIGLLILFTLIMLYFHKQSKK